MTNLTGLEGRAAELLLVCWSKCWMLVKDSKEPVQMTCASGFRLCFSFPVTSTAPSSGMEQELKHSLCLKTTPLQ